MYSFTIKTPFSNLGVTTEEGVLVGIEMIADDTDIRPRSAADKDIARQIRSYSKQADTGFKLNFKMRGTDFQKKVWKALQNIPAGKVQTYGQLAQKLSTSARAVGNACRRNHLLLVVPCHRVVAANGLGGFSGARMGRWPAVKRRLLAHEGVIYD